MAACLLSRVLAGRKVVIRFEGRDEIKDIELTDDNLREMRDVLLVYRFLGGKWRAD